MDQLTLHIGHQKTGTTSLQFTLRDSSAVLARHGLHYEASHATHHPMARAFHDDLGTPADRRLINRHIQALKASPLPQGLVSTETFVRLRPDEVSACVKRMKQIAGRLKVLVYVRHPLSFASSAAHQRVRMGNPLLSAIETPMVFPARVILDRWAAAVGEDNMIVRPFDRRQLKNGDVIDDALTTLGFPQAIDGLTRVSTNESLSVLGIHLMDEANRIAGKALPTAVLRAFDAIAGPRYVLPQSTLDRVREVGQAEVDYVESRFGVALPLPDPLPQPTELPALSAAELHSTAEVILNLAHYAFDLTKSPAGRLLDQPSPYALFDVKPHPLTPAVEKLGLMPFLKGEPRKKQKPADGK